MIRRSSGSAPMEVENFGGGEGFMFGLPPRMTTRSISGSQGKTESQEMYDKMADIAFEETARAIALAKATKKAKGTKEPTEKEIVVQGIAVLEDKEAFVPNNAIFVRDLRNDEQRVSVDEAINALLERLTKSQTEKKKLQFVKFHATTTIVFKKNITKVVGLDKHYLTKKIITTEKKEKITKIAEFNNKARKIGARLLKQKKVPDEVEITDSDSD
jgi:hypothetical protein